MVDVILAWSGGKDSTLAQAALRADPRYRVRALLTVVTDEYDRVSIHGVRCFLTDVRQYREGYWHR